LLLAVMVPAALRSSTSSSSGPVTPLGG